MASRLNPFDKDIIGILLPKKKKAELLIVPKTICAHCKDEGYWKNNWGVLVPCICTHKCSVCKGKGYYYDYDKVTCKCVFGQAIKDTDEAKKEKQKKGLPVIELGSDLNEAEYFPNGIQVQSEEALKSKMAVKGVELDIVPAKKNELQIDYDQDEVPEQFKKMLPILRQRFDKGTIYWKKQRSASGQHWHVIITLPEDITDQERIMWQAVFGSDFMREGLSVLRVAAGMENPTLLFVPKNTVPVEMGIVEERPARKFKELDE
jgi:hypothetical protein